MVSQTYTQAQLDTFLAAKATPAQIAAAITGLVNGASTALDTLSEIDAQLAADEGSAAALAVLVGQKAPLASPAFTGTPTLNGSALGASGSSPGSGMDLLEGADFQSDGHSYGVPAVNGTNQPRTTWFQRTASRLKSTTYTNNNVSGAQAADCAGKAAASASPSYQGVVFWDCVINDANRNATTGTLAGFQSALFTWLSIRRAAARFEAEAYATETGTWASASDAYASNSTVRQTITQNAKQSYAVSGAAGWFVTLGGGVGATAMGTAVIAIDGATVATVPLTGIYAATQNNSSRTWFPYAVPITLADTAAHTITVTKSDASTGPVIVDAIYARGLKPPLIVINKAIYPTSGASSSTVDTYNAAIDTVVAQVATDNTILTCDPQAAGFSTSTMTIDGLHPSNYGAAFIASVVTSKIRSLSTATAAALRLSADYNGPITSAAVVGVPNGGLTVSDTFTRADSTSSLGTATSGQSWNVIRGTWGITGNTAYSVTHADDDLALIPTGLTDQHVTATMTYASGASLVVRSDATAANYYLLYINSTNAQLQYRVGGGSYVSVGAVRTNLNIPSGSVVELDVVGSAFTLKVGGTAISTWTDATIASGTYAGLRQGGTVAQTWDNFTVG